MATLYNEYVLNYYESILELIESRVTKFQLNTLRELRGAKGKLVGSTTFSGPKSD